MPAGAFYGQEATMPAGAFYGQEATMPARCVLWSRRVIQFWRRWGQRVFILMLLGLVGFIGWRALKALQYQSDQAERLETAVKMLEARTAEPASLLWLPEDSQTPRSLERFRQDQIGTEYRAALKEITFAHLSGDSSGLPTYFQEGALKDAQLAAATDTQAKMVDWDHRLQLHFYAPDGSTISFTDTAWFAEALEDKNTLEDVHFSRRTTDVVMQLDDGNWRVHHWRVMGIQELPTGLKPSLTLPAELSRLRGVNYVGNTHPFDAFWANYDPEEVRSSLALTKQLDLNALRVFIPFPASDAAIQNLPKFLDKAKLAGLKIIVTLLDHYTVYRLEDLPRIFYDLARLQKALRHPAVFAIDIKNEAERDAPKAGWDRIRAILGFIATWLRHNTGKYITAGLTTPDLVLSKTLDFVTIHHYGSVAALGQHLNQARATQKPVLLEEFGFHTQTDKLPDPHTEGDQARFYAAMLGRLALEKIGFIAWTLHDFPEGSMPDSRQVERHLGLVRSDGSLKPAARVLIGEAAPPATILDWLQKLSALKSFLPALLLGVLVFSVWRYLQLRARQIRSSQE